MINILEYLDEAARKWPDKTAYTDGSYALSFRHTYERAHRIGSFLARKGYRDIPVVVFMGRSPDTVTAFFGAVYAGCAYVPVDPEMSRNRIEGIFENLNPQVVIYDKEAHPLLDSLAFGGAAYEYADMMDEPVDEMALGEIRRQAIDTDLLYIVYTSGSTGKPKGVAACHRSVIDYIESLSEVLGISHNTVFGNQTPLYVDACLKELYPTLKCGATAFLIPKSLFLFPVRLVDYLNEHRINTICWVVSALTIISGTGTLEKKKPDFLHTVAFGSELFPQVQLSRWRAALPGARFINLYGPTECTGMSCYYEVTRDFGPDESIPIGRPFRNTHILLLDGDSLVTEAEHEGEICIRGTSLALGYYNDPEKTNGAFVQNPLNKAYRELIYRTGDMGKYNGCGELVFGSRRDHQVKHMGHRIELGEIESAAWSCEGIVRAACIYDNDKKKLVLFFSGTASAADAMRYLRERLPRFMCPNAMIPLEALPLTPNGKIDRIALEAIYKTRIKREII